MKEKDALVETLSDHNATILRFRDLVQKLRDENLLLRRSLEEESSKSIPGLSEAMDFKVLLFHSIHVSCLLSLLVIIVIYSIN